MFVCLHQYDSPSPWEKQRGDSSVTKRPRLMVQIVCASSGPETGREPWRALQLHPKAVETACVYSPLSSQLERQVVVRSHR